MKKLLLAIAVLLTVTSVSAAAQNKKKKQETPAGPEIVSQWQGKKVVFLGDSITDPRLFKEDGFMNYWGFLQRILGLEPLVYGRNGHKTTEIIGQAQKVEAEHGQDFDAIMIFVGTNDYFDDCAIGSWFNETRQEATVSGPFEAYRLHREKVMGEDTFKGRINVMMNYLKSHFPTKQIILLTPIHRSYATFGPSNIQLDEAYANSLGYYIDDYVNAIKEASSVWAVPVIDLNSICGLYPSMPEYNQYFENKDTDRLHPNGKGHERMAYALAYQMLGYPASFRD